MEFNFSINSLIFSTLVLFLSLIIFTESRNPNSYPTFTFFFFTGMENKDKFVQWSSETFSTLVLLPLSLIIIIIFTKSTNPNANPNSISKLPKSYPIFGSFFSVLKNKDRFVQWSSEIVTSTPNLTFSLHRGLGRRFIFTADPSNVRHILKNSFHSYEKGDYFKTNLKDFLGDGIFNAYGEKWKKQRQVAIHEFNTKSLRKFVETVVDSELNYRLIPILREAGEENSVVHFQEILQRFAFDNVCIISFGYDPEHLSPSRPEEKFAAAFERAVKLSSERFTYLSPLIWKFKKAIGFGSEKELKKAVKVVRDFAKGIIREKKQEMEQKSSLESVDLLSRFLSSGHSDEDFITDIVTSFIIGGRDSTSAALTWFFYLLSHNQEVEREILREINERSEATSVYEEVKDMVYTRAAICESMRLYPPIPMGAKEALNDDVLPDGTVVKKGMRVLYHPYAMGRVERVWGEDWQEFRPTRWLEAAAEGGKWNFVNRDPYTYPVFQAGPRICIGKEMAFLQMKRVVAGVVRRFRVVPVMEEEPVFLSDLAAKMKGGFPVRIQERK